MLREVPGDQSKQINQYFVLFYVCSQQGDIRQSPRRGRTSNVKDGQDCC